MSTSADHPVVGRAWLETFSDGSQGAAVFVLD
jgi:hypothetical protein